MDHTSYTRRSAAFCASYLHVLCTQGTLCLSCTGTRRIHVLYAKMICLQVRALVFCWLDYGDGGQLIRRLGQLDGGSMRGQVSQREGGGMDHTKMVTFVCPVLSELSRRPG